MRPLLSLMPCLLAAALPATAGGISWGGPRCDAQAPALEPGVTSGWVQQEPWSYARTTYQLRLDAPADVHLVLQPGSGELFLAVGVTVDGDGRCFQGCTADGLQPVLPSSCSFHGQDGPFTYFVEVTAVPGFDDPHDVPFVLVAAWN